MEGDKRERAELQIQLSLFVIGTVLLQVWEMTNIMLWGQEEQLGLRGSGICVGFLDVCGLIDKDRYGIYYIKDKDGGMMQGEGWQKLLERELRRFREFV